MKNNPKHVNIAPELNASTGIAGKPLHVDTRKCIIHYVMCPSSERWENIHHIIINDQGTTLWEAVCEVDKDFPRQKHLNWLKIPTPSLLKKAMAVAVGLEKQ